MIKFADFQQNFHAGTTDLKIFRHCPYQINGCAVLLCKEGKATLSVGIEEFIFGKNGEMIILPDSTLTLISSSDDFTCDLFIFSKELYNELSFKLGINFSQYLLTTPFYIHIENSPKLKYIQEWMNTALLLHQQRHLFFWAELCRNFIQSYLIYLYNAVRDYLAETEKKISRKEILYHAFISVLNIHYKEQRDVAFYARLLHITERYLWIITHHVTGSESPKSIIDKKLILEIKLLLRSTSLTIQEIAHDLNFANQSNFGRYFRHHTGISPSGYKKQTYFPSTPLT